MLALQRLPAALHFAHRKGGACPRGAPSSSDAHWPADPEWAGRESEAGRPPSGAAWREGGRGAAVPRAEGRASDERGGTGAREGARARGAGFRSERDGGSA